MTTRSRERMAHHGESDAQRWEIDIESASRTIQATPRTANRH